MDTKAICVGSSSALRFWRSARSVGGTVREDEIASAFGSRAFDITRQVARARDLCLCEENQPLDLVFGGSFDASLQMYTFINGEHLLGPNSSLKRGMASIYAEPLW